MQDESFDVQSRWQRVDADRWQGEVAPSWAQGRATFGGVLTAAALEAMQSQVPAERRPRAVQTTFLGPVGPGRADLVVAVQREGRALTYTRAEIWQEGTLRGTILASFGADRASRIAVEPARRPAGLPDPDTLPEMPYLAGITPTFTQHFAYRWTHESYPFSGSPQAVVGGWVRHRTAATGGAGAVVAMLDAWPAPVLPLLRAPAPASTVSWTAYLVAVPVETPPGWWWFEADTLSANGGYATTRGRLFAPDGRLAAHMDQLVVVFDSPE